MFRLSSLRPDPEGVAGTLRLRKDPRKILNGIFGSVTDVDGKKWDLNGQVNRWVLARPYREDYWTSTVLMDYQAGATDGSGGLQSARWRSYEIEVVEDNGV